MASGFTSKVVVENLPPSWTSDHLQLFVGTLMPEDVKEDGVYTFKDITHSALLSLEKPVSVESVDQVELTQMPFKGQVLKTRAVVESTQTILVHYKDPDISNDHILYYFDTPECCGTAVVREVQMYPEALVAVVRFSQPEGVATALSKADHCIRKQDETIVMDLEPYYEEFHLSLLHEICTKTRQTKTPPPVPPKPKIKVSPTGQPYPAQQFPGYSEPAIKKLPEFGQPPFVGQQQTAVSRIGSNTKATEQPSRFRVGTPQRNTETDDTIEKLQKQMEKLQILTEKNEKLESENEKLKKVKTLTLEVPSYQLHLLKDFPARCESGCQVKFLEKNVLFTGTQEKCLQGKIQLMKEIQRLVDASIQVSPTVQRLLESPNGKHYLNDVVQRYQGCSVCLQTCCISCAAVDEENLNALTRELEAFASCQTCKLPFHLLQMEDFTVLRKKLESEYLVLLTLRNTSEEIQVEGLNIDVEQAIRDLQKFIHKNHADEVMFSIDGAMQAEACKHWYAKELDAAKQMIKQTGEILNETTDSKGYVLKYQCRQSVLLDVMEKLNNIKDGIKSTHVDLDKEFPRYSDCALVINGLHKMGVSPFCASYKDLLVQKQLESLGDIELPAKCTLPHFSIAPRSITLLNECLNEQRFQSRKKGGRDHRAQSKQGPHHGDGRGHQYSSRRSSPRDQDQPSVPCSYTIGNTTITVKPGDITTEQVAAAVSVIAKDLNPKGTAISAAFLNKCPSIAQALTAGSQGAGDTGGCHILVTPSSGGTLPMTTLYHAVLNKMPQHAVPKVVKQLVKQCLTLALSNGITSIAFPPLGVGRRFGFGRYTVANAMMTTFQEFLKSKPNSFQNISVVVADSNAIGRFAVVLKNMFGGTTPAATAGTPATAATGTTPAATAAKGTTPAATAATGTTPAATAPKGTTPAATAATGTTPAATAATGTTPAATGATGTTIAAASAAAPLAATSDNDSSASEDSDGDAVLETIEDDLPMVTKGRFRALVITKQAQDLKKAIDILLGLLRTIFLYHDTIQEDSLAKFHKLGTPVLKRIADAAEENDVYLSLRGEGLRLCGTKESVLTMKAMVHAELTNHLQQLGQKGTDRRRKLGLPINTEQMPSYWKIWKKVKDPAKKAQAAWVNGTKKLTSVTQEEQAAVVKLVQSTWDGQKAGAGKDARNLTHTDIKVKDVKRLENPGMWLEYCHRREQMICRLEYETDTSKACCTPVEKLPNSSGPLMTTANIAKGSPLTRDIYPQVNEHYLFHGTKHEALTKIYHQGLDFRMANDKTMLGRGLYTAESSTKADQYTDPKTARSATDQDLTMILVRVLLGEPFLSKAQNPEKFKRPPCRSCSKTDISCSCNGSRLFDSIIDDGGRIFREFVCYNESVCYPEYFITYNRLTQKSQ